MTLTPISDWCKHYALFFNDAGDFIGKKRISFKEKTFNYENHSFNFLPDNCSKFKIKRFFSTHKYYLYNYNDPNPYLLHRVPAPIVDSKTYKSILENKLVQELNSLANGGIWAFIQKYWIVILIVGFLVWYLATGQHFFGGGAVTNMTNISNFSNSSNSLNPRLPLDFVGYSNITYVRGGF